jgi:predicted alpha-1,2-mannosidase
LRYLKIPLALLLACLLAFLIVRPFLLAHDQRMVKTAKNILDLFEPDTKLAQEIDVFTGSGARSTLPAAYSGGETFPGADAPFGMVQWSPNTVRLAYGGYDYNDNRIKGFALTHLSGAGCAQYGDLPFLPFTGAHPSNPASYSVAFSHANELAEAGYYRVTLGNGVTSELTVTQRSGAGRFIYPAGASGGMLLNLGGSLNPVSDAQATLGRDTISGWVASGNFCRRSSNTYRLYFWAQFNRPFTSDGAWRAGSILAGQSEVTGPHAGVFVTFAPAQQNSISMRVGISYVSVANAEANVNAEDPGGNFATVFQQTTQAWNELLGEIRVSGGTARQRATFYTALYHALLFPSVYSDVNGQYMGFDGQIHTVPGGHAQYANFSGWDIYRSEAQLLALLAPAQAGDMAQSLVNDYEQGGILPKWSVANGESYVMVGDPADAIISDIYAFGGTNFDTQTALAAMLKQATQPGSERPGLNYLEEIGYEPLQGSYGCCNFYGPAATTLEYDTADFALSTFAGALGDQTNAQKFQKRAQDWRNLFNPATGYLEPRYLNGSFPATFAPASTSGWVEGNGAQYTWMVPFNLRGLFDALGGNASAVQRLDRFFTHLDAGTDAPYAFLGNEPTLETPWEYDYAGAPYKTQRVVHEVLSTLYSPGPAGLPGNDDLGEMSSWFVFAALGMYPETPGTAVLALSSPLFPTIVLRRPTGQVISINAPGVSSSAYYVQRLLVNGQPTSRPWLPATFIEQGGTLDYALSSVPNPSWGASAGDAPPSYQ